MLVPKLVTTLQTYTREQFYADAVAGINRAARVGETGETTGDDRGAIYRRQIPPGVEVYEINGPFFFGAAEKFKETLAQVSRRPKVLVIRMRNVRAIDSTAMHALKDLVRRTRGEGTQLLLSDIHSQPLVALGRSGLLEEIGEENLFGNVDEALEAARRHLGPLSVRPRSPE